MKTSAEKSSATQSKTAPPAKSAPFIAKPGSGGFFPPAPAAAGRKANVSSEVVDLAAGVFTPSPRVKEEIAAAGPQGLLVRAAAKGLAGEGQVKIREDRKGRYDSVGKGAMPYLNPWARQLGDAHICFTITNNEVSKGFVTFTPNGDKNDWLQSLQKNADSLGGSGLKINNQPTSVNEFASGTVKLGVTGLKVEVGGFLDTLFSVALENLGKPQIEATSEINIKGLAKGSLKLAHKQERLAGEVLLAIDFKGFSGAAKVIYQPDGTVAVEGKGAYNANRLSGEILFVATDEETARNFTKNAIAAAGGPANIQTAPAPAPVPAPKPGKKPRALAATGQLAFNLTNWFAGTVHVVVDSKGQLTVIGKIAPPAEIELFKQRDWDKELVKVEVKAYYGIPVVGNLNLFANISLRALASLGPAKIYNIEILGTYSTDPTVQKSIQIAASINISAYAGLRLRAEGGAGIEILDHDLKFGVGVQADVGVKAYADARPTIGYREPGEFYISGVVEMVAQPMLSLGGDFFIAVETPWWSPLSDARWTWPLFSKEWPLSDPIGISASVKEYVLGSGRAPEVELKKPEFDSSKFMTNMVDRTLPDKSGGPAAGQGSFKEDGSVPKPVVPPKKTAPKPLPAKAGKKGAPPKAGKSTKPDPNAAQEKNTGQIFKKAADLLKAVKGKEPLTRAALEQELAKIKAQIAGVDFNIVLQGDIWVITPKAGGKTGRSLKLKASMAKGEVKEQSDRAAGEGQKLDKGRDKTKRQVSNVLKRVGTQVLQIGVARDPEERSRRGMKAAVAVVNRFSGSEVGEEILSPLLKAVKIRYQFTALEVVPDGDVWNVEGAMSPMKTEKTKAKNPLIVYKAMLKALKLDEIKEKKARKFRKQMITAILAKYKDDIVGLNTDVLVSDIIPVAQNKLKGHIFEQWLQDNQIIDKPAPVFIHKKLYKKRISDGVKGSSLVDAKVRQPGAGPGSYDIEQMQDYNEIISRGIKSVNKNLEFNGPFVQVIYIFNDKRLVQLWRDALVSNLKGNYSTSSPLSE